MQLNSYSKKMSELKTLKDIDFKLCEELREIDTVEVNRLLRQEAIKWVKSRDIHKTSGQISFIKFFNLTEEDINSHQGKESSSKNFYTFDKPDDSPSGDLKEADDEIN